VCHTPRAEPRMRTVAFTQYAFNQPCLHALSHGRPVWVERLPQYLHVRGLITYYPWARNPLPPPPPRLSAWVRAYLSEASELDSVQRARPVFVVDVECSATRFWSPPFATGGGASANESRTSTCTCNLLILKFTLPQACASPALGCPLTEVEMKA